MNCEKCGRPAYMKSSISKKTGKPFSGFYCDPCKKWTFAPRENGNQQSTQQPNAPQSPADEKFKTINQKLDRILQILEQNQSADTPF